MDGTEDISMDSETVQVANTPLPAQVELILPHETPETTAFDFATPSTLLQPSSSQTADRFREIPVKIHIRKPDKDSWAYLGRGIVSQESFGQGSRIVVRSLQSRKVITAFSEGASIQAEKRGNFVVIACVESGRVVSWSLNALNNAETLRLLAIIELNCYSCKHNIADPQVHHYRRRIARVIKDDRRKRHRRRKEQDSMVAAFAKTGLEEHPELTPVPTPASLPMQQQTIQPMQS